MSVLGAEVTKNKIRFAYDSQSTVGNKFYTTNEHKAFKVKNYIVGASGNTVFKQYLRKFLEEKDTLPELNNPIDVCLLFDDFMNAYSDRDQLKLSSDDTAGILITDSKRLFYIGLPDFGCHEIEECEFIGSGWESAQGAYSALKKVANFDGDSLFEAIRVTCLDDLYCGEPVNLIETDKQ